MTTFLSRVLALAWMAALAWAEDPTWTANWISPQAPAAVNQWICYRTTVTCGAVPTAASALIACDSKYWLWINGELVVFEGQLKRGPTPTDTYVDRVPLGSHLKPGANTIAVLVWYFGKDGFSHRSSGKPGLLVQADLGASSVRSGADWKARVHPAYGDAGDPKPNYRLPESSIGFDARLDLPGWTAPGYDDHDWPAAVACGVPPTAPWNQLVERPTPLWRDGGLQPYQGLTLPFVSDGKPIVCHLPENLQVTPWLDVEAPEGAKIDIRTDNFQGGGAPNVHATYVTRAGRQTYESLGWMNGHDVRYTIPAGVTVHGLRYRPTGYDADIVGTFTSNDADLNTLWCKSRTTLSITMRDTYMDCPDRERAQWWGDAVNELGEAFYVFDSARGPLLARKGMRELTAWQKPNGSLFAPIPGNWTKELPPQMLATIGWYGFRLYHWYTGDRDTIAATYPAVRRYLDLWQQDANGLAVHRKGDWDWSDWGNDIDVAVLDNAWLALAFQGAADLAVIAGQPQDAEGYTRKREAIVAAFDRMFWTGTCYRSPTYKAKTDDRAQALAVVAGLVPTERHGALRAVLRQERHASPYMEKYVLEALCRMGYEEDALARMKERYAEQIASPLTTLWEGWGIGGKGFGGGTYNHAWSGGPLTILSQHIAGISPAAVGWKAIRIAPRPAGLTRIETTAPTPAGPVFMSWERTAQGATLRITAPAGVPTTVTMPTTDPTGLRINGKTPVSLGLTTATDDRATVTVPGGTWTFTGP